MLDPLLPTLLIATLCLCVLLTILYYSLAIAWEVFWATRQSPSPLDPSTEVVLTQAEETARRDPVPEYEKQAPGYRESPKL